MELNEYQRCARQFSRDTVIQDNKLFYPLLGLAGEVGEIMEKIKKLYRDHDGILDEAKKLDIVLEIGDCLWYLSELSYQLDFNFNQIAYLNLEKLTSRKMRNKLSGSGDHR